MDQIRNFHQIFSWFLGQNSLSLDREGPWAVDMIAQNIGYLYRNLPIMQFPKEEIKVSIEAISESHYYSHDKKFLSPIIDLHHYALDSLKEDLEAFLIHGSMASLDYSIGWSDLDTYVIVKEETIIDKNKLLSLRKKILDSSEILKRIDPLQHHGFIFATKYDLSNYFSHCLPLEVLQESRSLLDNTELFLNYYRDKKDTRSFLSNKFEFFKNCYDLGVMDHHALHGIKLLDNYAEKNSMYQMKYFLSVLMSMPAFFLDSIGQASYKKDSFDKAKLHFSDNWEIIESASKIREKWQTKEDFPYQGNLIPKWLMEDLGKNYFKRAYFLAKEMKDKSKKF